MIHLISSVLIVIILSFVNDGRVDSPPIKRGENKPIESYRSEKVPIGQLIVV